jgi:hypothetical protein
MKVILNSDVLYHSGTLLRDELSRGLTSFFETCRDQGHEIVVPETVSLEFQRHQREEAEKERGRVRDALQVLDKHSLKYEEVDADAAVREPDLMTLIASSGVRVTDAQPQTDDLREASRRAALREAPHPGTDTKSDEMRDLLIWLQAVRIAREDGGALLVSMDKIHRNERGNAEAQGVNLTRVNVEEALEFLNIRTPAASIIDGLLQLAWPSLAAARPSLPDSIELRRVRRASFVQGEGGLASAAAEIEADADGCVLNAKAEFRIEGGVVTRAALRHVRLGDDSQDDVESEPAAPWDETPTEYEQQLAELREILGQ